MIETELELRAATREDGSALAVYPETRGRGVGTRLLEHPELCAIACERLSLSLIVSDGNPGARRLYERVGFRDVAARAMVKERWQSEGQNWILMTKEIET